MLHEDQEKKEHGKEKLKDKKDSIKNKEHNHELKLLKQKLEEKNKEAEENKILAQRIKAEFDNYKKRVWKEYDENAKLSNESLIIKLLTVIDAFQRALKINGIDNEQFKSFYNGAELIYKQLMNILNEYGLKEINPVKGDIFDPAVHQAVLAEGLDDSKEHVILEVFEIGYILSKKLLRAAKVKVGN